MQSPSKLGKSMNKSIIGDSSPKGQNSVLVKSFRLGIADGQQGDTIVSSGMSSYK